MINVVVVGATGLVGKTMLKILEERNFPVSDLRLIASERSVGKTMYFNGNTLRVEPIKPDSFENFDIALFSAGAKTSHTVAPLAIESGCYVIDNSSAWRMSTDVPLIVPEVNAQDIEKYWALSNKKGLVANPNCSTIQLVLALSPIHKAVGIERVAVTTFQSVSGTGRKGMIALESQSNDALLSGQRCLGLAPAEYNAYPHQIAFNCIPHIGDFDKNGNTAEELKIVNETRKIMNAPYMPITATCVRVPVFFSHAESVNLQTRKKISVSTVHELLSETPGVQIVDDSENNAYPMQIDSAGKDEVFVGRIREDSSALNSLNMWVVADNLHKGAATNAVQIAEIIKDTYL